MAKNSVYSIKDDKPVVASGNVNPVRERVTKEWREAHKGEEAPVQYDSNGNALYKVEYLKDEESFGESHMVTETVKVPDGEWRKKMGKFAQIRFVNLTLMVGDLRDAEGRYTGRFESLSADDIITISPGMPSSPSKPAVQTPSMPKHE